jgi:hypothetical protein
MNEISINELRLALEVALADLEEMGVSKITISEDYYWKVPKEGRYNFKSDPPELDCGQLSDDVRWLKGLLCEGGTYTSLMFLSGIIDYISSRSMVELKETSGQGDKKSVVADS